MIKCWSQEQDERPTFSELQNIFDTVLSTAKTASNTDLNFEDFSPSPNVAEFNQQPKALAEMQGELCMEEPTGYQNTSEIGNTYYPEIIERSKFNTESGSA